MSHSNQVLGPTSVDGQKPLPNPPLSSFHTNRLVATTTSPVGASSAHIQGQSLSVFNGRGNLPNSHWVDEQVSSHELMRPAANAPENAQNAQLTDRQLDFVARLSTTDVPVSEIERLMARMRAGVGASGQASESGQMRVSMNPGTTVPPSYDDISQYGV